MGSRETSPSHPPVYSNYLEPYPGSSHIADTRDREYGWVTSHVVSYYDSSLQEESKKVAKTAMHYSMPEEHVEAALSYRDAYPVTMEARIAVNLFEEGSQDVTPEDVRTAQNILHRMKGKRDPYLTPAR